MSSSSRWIVAVFFALAGCQGTFSRSDVPDNSPEAAKVGLKLPAKDRDNIAKALVKMGMGAGLTLDSVNGWDQNRRLFTIENELAYVGAQVGTDGKLRDRNGKEITFFRYGEFGIDPGPEWRKRRNEEFQALQARSTVIELHRDPRTPSPP